MASTLREQKIDALEEELFQLMKRADEIESQLRDLLNMDDADYYRDAEGDWWHDIRKDEDLGN